MHLKINNEHIYFPSVFYHDAFIWIPWLDQKLGRASLVDSQFIKATQKYFRSDDFLHF